MIDLGKISKLVRVLKKILKIFFITILLIAIISFVCVCYYRSKSNVEYNFNTTRAYSELTPRNHFDNKMLNVIYKNSNRIANRNIISFAIIDNDSVYFYGLGRERDTLFFQPNADSIFILASITKVFTSLLLTNLYLQDTINSSTTIDKLFGFKLNEDLKISVGSIANHTSGLSRDPYDYGSYSQTDYNYSWTKMDFLKKEIKLDSININKFNYSNLGFSILGGAISAYKNIAYHHLIREEIFSKYGMYNSFIMDGRLLDNLVRSYDQDGNLLSPESLNLSFYESSACVASNAKDLSAFVLANLNPKDQNILLSHKETFKADTNLSIGTGWMISETNNGHKVYYHGGAWMNSSTCIAFDKETKAGIVILSSYPLHIMEIDIQEFAIDLLMAYLQSQQII